VLSWAPYSPATPTLHEAFRPVVEQPMRYLAGRHGYTFTAAKRVPGLSPSWTRIAALLAAFRAWRLGAVARCRCAGAHTRTIRETPPQKAGHKLQQAGDESPGRQHGKIREARKLRPFCPQFATLLIRLR
jgi:hypothetical protein